MLIRARQGLAIDRQHVQGLDVELRQLGHIELDAALRLMVDVAWLRVIGIIIIAVTIQGEGLFRC